MFSFAVDLATVSRAQLFHRAHVAELTGSGENSIMEHRIEPGFVRFRKISQLRLTGKVGVDGLQVSFKRGKGSSKETKEAYEYCFPSMDRIGRGEVTREPVRTWDSKPWRIVRKAVKEQSPGTHDVAGQGSFGSRNWQENETEGSTSHVGYKNEQLCGKLSCRQVRDQGSSAL